MAAFLAISIVTTFFLLHVQSINANCPTNPNHCPGDHIEIRFPFWIRDTVDPLCGFPGFDLACNNQNRIVIHLPHSGEFMVTNIDYEDQSLMIDDPDDCFLNRISSFTLFDTPFDYSGDFSEFTFANCTPAFNPEDGPELSYVTCLSNQNYSVYYVEENDMDQYNDYLTNLGCHVWTMAIPGKRKHYWGDTWNGLLLRWEEPNCKSCELRGGTCVGKMNYSDVGCEGNDTGFSRSTKIWVFIGVALPWLVCLFATTYYWSTRTQRPPHNQQNIELLPTNVAELPPRAVPGMVGLDAATIESYPKIQIKGVHELPKPNDSTCIICLAEYQRRETIKIMPECNHFFHAYCIDQWLKRNPTCPLCRNHKGFSECTNAS